MSVPLSALSYWPQVQRFSYQSSQLQEVLTDNVVTISAWDNIPYPSSFSGSSRHMMALMTTSSRDSRTESPDILDLLLLNSQAWYGVTVTSGPVSVPQTQCYDSPPMDPRLILLLLTHFLSQSSHSPNELGIFSARTLCCRTISAQPRPTLSTCTVCWLHETKHLALYLPLVSYDEGDPRNTMPIVTGP